MVAAASQPSTEECEDIATILAMPKTTLEASVSRKLCTKNGTVGAAFTHAVLDVMDSDADGMVACSEWVVLKKQGKARCEGIR